MWRVVLSCGVRARGALFYKVSAGSVFLSGNVKNRHFLKKWCSKWCSKKEVQISQKEKKVLVNGKKKVENHILLFTIINALCIIKSR